MNIFRRLLRPIPASMIAIGFAGSVWAATVSLLTGPIPAADIQGTLNTLINSINSAFGTAGGASLNQVIYAPTVTTPVNLFALTAGATTVVPQIAAGGSGADANIGIALLGAGTGGVYLGGTTAANAAMAVAHGTANVNQIIATGTNTGTLPSIVVGGSGADANRGLFVAGNGTGPVYIGGTTTTLAGLQVAQTASAVNDVVITNAATGAVPSIALGGAGADANRDMNVVAAGTGIITLGQARATCSGTTTATCQGQRFIVSITGLTTAAAGVESAAMTVTNASVVSAASIVLCNVNIYAGTGDPIATRVTPGTGTVSVTITNVAGAGSLNATVPVACVVF